MDYRKCPTFGFPSPETRENDIVTRLRYLGGRGEALTYFLVTLSKNKQFGLSQMQEKVERTSSIEDDYITMGNTFNPAGSGKYDITINNVDDFNKLYNPEGETYEQVLVKVGTYNMPKELDLRKAKVKKLIGEYPDKVILDFGKKNKGFGVKMYKERGDGELIANNISIVNWNTARIILEDTTIKRRKRLEAKVKDLLPRKFKSFKVIVGDNTLMIKDYAGELIDVTFLTYSGKMWLHNKNIEHLAGENIFLKGTKTYIEFMQLITTSSFQKNIKNMGIF